MCAREATVLQVTSGPKPVWETHPSTKVTVNIHNVLPRSDRASGHFRPTADLGATRSEGRLRALIADLLRRSGCLLLIFLVNPLIGFLQGTTTLLAKGSRLNTKWRYQAYLQSVRRLHSA
jgi:hypothetical protein